MRKNRFYSSTGCYHVVSRGVNKQNIFLDQEDKEYFKKLLYKFGEKYNTGVHVYTLLDNHVHLLLESPDKNVSSFMQVVCSVYARYFNKKYDRVGHLFQNRFISEPILDEKYFKIVLRYILRNSDNAGLEPFYEYKWNSFKEYMNEHSKIIKTKIFSYFRNIDDLRKFLNFADNEADCIDIEMRYTEKQVKIAERIRKILKTDSTLIPPELPIDELKLKLRKLRDAGLSIRMISRFTGIMTWIVAAS